MNIRTLIPSPRTVVAVAAIALAATACGDSGPSDDSLDAAISTYAEGVHASYAASVVSATAMDGAIDAFIAAPSAGTLETAKDSWLAARNDYSPTEAFRFYEGPIDDVTNGKEGLINAWPLDEGYIDYVEGAPGSGVINDAATFPTIDADLLVSLNEDGGEANISTGWHAIEFLLWGQDLDLTGPGKRSADDYTTADNADRRATYLSTVSDLLIGHLTELEAAWAPGATNYRAEFLALENKEALNRIITGIGELSRGELAGERMNVAFSERSQEDEHSCFSDNTTNDIAGNARGIEMVLNASYPSGVTGTSILDVVEEADAELAEKLRGELTASLDAVAAIPAPFDQHLVDGVSDDDPGRAAVLTGIVALEDQTDTIVDAATALGVTINVT